MSAVAGAAVVVGADGSDQSLAAVRAAATQAVERHRTLRIVHAFIWPSLGVAVGPPVGGPPELGLRQAAVRILEEAQTQAEEAAPGVIATTHIVDGAAAAVLLGESRDAVMLVIGDRGLGGFGSLMLGSVALHTTVHAACPVLVIRGEQRASGPVVVGVDGSASSALAIDFAAEEASRRNTTLVAVHVRDLRTAGPADVLLPEAGSDEGGLVLSEALSGLAQAYPDVVVRPELIRGKPAEVLLGWSRSAQLVVTGARGRGGFVALLLGSVSHTVMHNAGCPVAVIRTAASAK